MRRLGHGAGAPLQGRPRRVGATLYLAPGSLALVRTWLGRSGVREGAVFRSLNRGALGERLDASQVPRIFKAMAERAGLPGDVVERISGHSTRVGAAQDMVAKGVPIAAIQNAGRWKTTAMVNRYGERLVARRSGAAQLARLQRRAKRGGVRRGPMGRERTELMQKGRLFTDCYREPIDPGKTRSAVPALPCKRLVLQD